MKYIYDQGKTTYIGITQAKKEKLEKLRRTTLKVY